MSNAENDANPTKIGIFRRRRTVKVTIQLGEISVTGSAKCRRSDKFSSSVGEGIAVGRAFTALGNALSELWETRAQTVEDWKRSHPGKSLPPLP